MNVAYNSAVFSSAADGHCYSATAHSLDRFLIANFNLSTQAARDKQNILKSDQVTRSK